MKKLNIHIKAALLAILFALPIIILITYENMNHESGAGFLDLSDMLAPIPYMLGLPLTSLVYALPIDISLKSPYLIYILLIANILFIAQWVIWSQAIVLIFKLLKK